MLKPKLILILICIFFLVTRLIKINEIPPSVYWDEASIGYNAYSISQTGKDEWGEWMPLHFRAFGEFKLPVYIYSTVPFVKIFGLNEFSVRIPAVLFSLGVVILTYLLTKRLTGKEWTALISSFFVAISPWFFIFSRIGYEATAGLMFYLLAIYTYLGYAKNKYSIFFATLFFILSMYSYNSFRLISPITILLLLAFDVKNLSAKLSKSKLSIALSVVILMLALVPVYRLYVYDAGASRLQVVKSSDYIHNYLSHFNLDFLLKGDKNSRSQQAGFGQIYFSDLILLALGIYVIYRKRKENLLPLMLLLLGPVPAVITRESPHALRAISAIPFICIITAIGASYINEKIGWKNIFGYIVVIVFLTFFANYFINFLTTYPTNSSKDWQYGYKKIFMDFKDEFSKYDKVIISDEYAQPYIFALFYLKYPPQNLANEIIRNPVSEWGFSTVSKFNKFEFRKVDSSENLEGALVFTDKEIQDKKAVETVNFLDGSNAFFVYHD